MQESLHTEDTVYKQQAADDNLDRYSWGTYVTQMKLGIWNATELANYI